MTGQPLRQVILAAERVLAGAGVATPRVDAELIAAHVLGVDRGGLVMVTEVDAGAAERIRALAGRRAARVPLQHLTGSAVIGPVTVEVGPGVFVPRPETELLLDWGLGALRGRSGPLVVDLCTGSAALALAFAAARPDATVHAVELDPAALAWARRNAASHHDRPVVVHAGDVADPALLASLAGRVDLLVCNPPYVPDGTDVPPEVARHDPVVAVFAGPDGLAVIRHVVTAATRLLRPGGSLAIEHDESHGQAVLDLLSAGGALTDVEDHDDLAGRPRFATARLAQAVHGRELATICS